MKFLYLLSFVLLATSCQFTETLIIKSDGSGSLQTTALRDEQSYMNFVMGDYNKEEIYRDTTYVVKDFITKHAATYDLIADADKAVFEKYRDVQIHIKKNSFQKEYFTTISQKFTTLDQAADLYKTLEYVSDICNNYALSAEEHYYKVSYAMNEKLFRRIVVVTDKEELLRQVAKIDTLKSRYGKINLVKLYRLEYHFPSRIKSVSNLNASIDADRKSMILDFDITDCLQNPESTNLEVILE